MNGVPGPNTLTKPNYIVISLGNTASLLEGFENNTFPPTQWNTAAPSDATWQHVDTVGGFGLSTHAAFYDNFNHDAGGNHDALIAPKIDLHNVDSAYVTFDVAYARYSAAYPDSLVVQISTDCGDTYSPIYTKSGDVLATAPDNGSYFVPAATEWRRDSISLNAYLNNGTQLSFENVGHYGNTLYLDNINIKVYPHPVGINAVNNSAGLLQVYPNPSTGIFTLSGHNISGKDVVVDCYNMTGALISRRNIAVTNGSFNTSLNLSGYPRGIYQLNIETAGGEHYSRKLVLQ
jgi:hypothetical protein